MSYALNTAYIIRPATTPPFSQQIVGITPPYVADIFATSDAYKVSVHTRPRLTNNHTHSLDSLRFSNAYKV